MNEFVHLHLHTEYSILDGLCALDRGKDHHSPLMDRAKALGAKSLAITDHGNVFGLVHFYKQAKAYGLKPILGCEVYVTPLDHTKRELFEGRQANHLVLLAENFEGYTNLLKLVSLSHLEGMYYKPRIDRPLLAQYSKGLIALSACLKGEVTERMSLGRKDEARAIAAEYAEIMGKGNFFIELQDHGLAPQKAVNPDLVALARELDLPLVATNDVHYLSPQDKEAHEMLLCLQTQDKWSNPHRMKYGSDQFYFKSADEMAALFPDHPEALRNTLAIAERCNVELKLGGQKNPHFPTYVCPDGLSHKDYIRRIAGEGIRKKYGLEDLDHPRNADEQRVADRYFHEIDIIEKTGFLNYFLVVWDFIHAAKQRGIPVGPGRGSGAGSLVAYAMGITELDPLRYGLIFERFLNPERVSPPDFDVDFCQTRRGEAIEYVRDKYGHDAVAQIATFGTLGAKTLIRDIGRALEFPLSECDRIAKLIPDGPNVSLKAAMEASEDFAKEAATPGSYLSEILRYAPPLEDAPRQTGTHAAGVIIGEQKLFNFIPLMRDKEGNVQAQWESVPLEEIGLLKMDFLGLKTLTVIQEACDLVAETRGEKLDPLAFPLDDKETYRMLARGDTIAVFQVESEGMKKLLKDLDINRIEELIAMIALYRPGPMQNIPTFIARKLGREKIEYAHPLLEPILSETYGIFVYQEQIQQAAGALAGFSMGQGDVLRRAMGKKKPDVMAKQREAFVAGCVKKGTCDERKAGEIFDIIVPFAAYGFNKSHSAAYGIVTFQTAYLKAHYMAEFMAATLSLEMGNTDKLPVLIQDIQAHGIQVLPPSVNESGLRYTPVVHADGSAIRFGLGGIKGVGMAAAEAIIAERKKNGPFKSFVDFCERVDNAAANSRAIECLIKAGAFDFTGVPRGCLVQKIPVVAEHAARTRADHANGQRSLLDLLGEDEDTGLRLTDRDLVGPDPWSLTTKLNFEREMIGFFVSGHPLAKSEWILKAYNLSRADKIASLPNDARTRIGGLVARLAKRTTKKVPPTQWLSFDLETLEGNVSCAVFGESVSAVGGKLAEGAEVMLVGSVRTNDRGTSLSVDEVHPLEEVPKLFSTGLNVKLTSRTATKENVGKMKEAFARFPGKTPVTFFVKQPDGGGTARVVSEAKVEIAEGLLKELKEIADGVAVAALSDAGLEAPRRRFRAAFAPR